MVDGNGWDEWRGKLWYKFMDVVIKGIRGVFYIWYSPIKKENIVFVDTTDLNDSDT